MEKIGNIKAIIFDMDGVISDTQVIHAKVESDILKNYGINLHPDDITKKYAGWAAGEMFEKIFKDFNKEKLQVQALIKEKWKRMNEFVCGGISEIPGTIDFIKSAKSHNLPIAVASGSRLLFIKLVLSELEILDKFNAIASAEEVERGKPEPDLFLLASKRLSIEPVNCLVIEDGISGMIAAKKAGMKCIGLVPDKDNRNYPAEILVKNLCDVPIKSII